MRKDPTVPPRVSGPTRFMMGIKCQRMTLKLNSASKSTNAVVHVKWWGEEEGVTLHPLNINSSIKSSGITSFSWSVKCLKKQLSDYLSDMGNLNIIILDGEKTIGIVRVPVSAFAKDPIRPINSFYPIFSFDDKAENVGKNQQLKSKKIGELHVVLELKSVTAKAQVKEKSNNDMNVAALSDNAETQTPKKKPSSKV